MIEPTTTLIDMAAQQVVTAWQELSDGDYLACAVITSRDIVSGMPGSLK